MALVEFNPAPRLPPGVYFSPTKPESVLTYLNRWIARDAMPDADGWVIEDDVYAESPDVLARRYRPASTRDGEPSWWFLCHCRLQPTRGGRGRSTQRGDRRVDTGGYWKLEQTKQDVECAVSRRRLGFKRNFGFYKVHGKKEGERAKTCWLMEEFTSVACPEDGFARDDGRRVLPALCRIYVTPRDHEDKKGNNKRGRWVDDDDDNDNYGENDDGAAMRGGRAVVPAAYFDAIAALLPPSSVRGVGGQDQAQDNKEAPPPEPGTFDQYKRHEASSDDDHAMNIHDMWQMGRDVVLADSSWID